MAQRAKSAQEFGRVVPLLVKIAPDLSMGEKDDIAQLAIDHMIDGLVVSNTTISRPETLRDRNKIEQGGLSGAPLFELSTAALADMYRLTGGKLPLVGVGGVSNAAQAYTKIRSGATLVQLYTALVYRGFGVVREIQKGLVEHLKKDGFSHVSQAVGVDVKR
jgi:dihydroorotate dehydrogenase